MLMVYTGDHEVAVGSACPAGREAFQLSTCAFPAAAGSAACPETACPPSSVIYKAPQATPFFMNLGKTQSLP